MNAILGIVGSNGETRPVEPADFEIAVMGKEGDVKTIWNPQNTAEVEHARETFRKFRKDGYLAFKVNADGSTGEQLTEFDPGAAKMIMVPQFQGG